VKAAVWYGAKDVRVGDVPEPDKPGPDEFVLRSKLVGICGTDVHEYVSGPHVIPTTPHPLTGAKAPIILGHEFGGEVLEVGSEVSRVKPGDKVSIQPLLYCGRCYYCVRGDSHLCTRGAGTGLSYQWGGTAPYVVLKEYQAVHIPDVLSWEQAALVEPAAVAAYGVERSGLRTGDVALVSGCGPIGALALLAARAAGAAAVYVSETSPPRASLARQLGATEVLDPRAQDVPAELRERTDGIGVDVALECAGVAPSLQTCVRSLRSDGTVAQVALFVGPAEVEPFDWALRNIRLVGCWCFHTFGFERIAQLMANGTYPAEKIVTSRVPVDDIVERGFEQLIKPGGEQVKILVEPAA
jgi:(R,R)-butanediol dehydrogenase/meso-butanediol dehydrogenase/diacetyl reductase